MRHLLMAVLVPTLLSGAPLLAAGQTTERSSSSTSGLERRASQVERREEARLRAKATTTIQQEFFARIAPSLEATDSGTKFAPALHLVSQPADGQWAYTLRTAFRTQRARDISKSRTTGGGVGADLQLTKDDHALGVFIASGDFVKVADAFDLGAATLEFDRNIGDHVTLIGSASYARLAPEEGDSSTDVIPGLALQVSDVGSTSAVLLAEYTFKNDVDGEDDFAFSVRFKLTPESTLRVGTGKHGRVFATFVHVLRK